MSDVDLLADEFEGAPKKKRGLPKWLFGCGCGCTILVIAICSVLIMAGMEMADAEQQWPNLRDELYFEERPTELELIVAVGIPFMDPNQYTLRHKSDQYMITLHAYNIAEQVEVLFKTEGKGIEKLGIPKNAVLGEIEVQGRMVRSMRDTGMALVGDAVGPGIRIDISTEDNMRVVELRAIAGADPLDEETIAKFFSLFDVWHE